MKATPFLAWALAIAASNVPSLTAAVPALFERANTVAWCIVPFDSAKRGPAERAALVKRLGLTKVAYDWRAEHLPQFEQEILEYKKHGLEFFAFWGQHEEAFRLFQVHGLHPQIWQTAPSPTGTTDREELIRKAAAQLLPKVERAKALGCQFGLYNHLGWGGEPENLVAVCDYLRKQHGCANVGIVYNFHHGHSHVDRLAAALAAMKPYLLCLNLNGMTREGDKRNMKILPLGQGELDTELLRVVAASGYAGPIGIIGHTMDDVELRLRDNLEGLDWLAATVSGKAAGPKPVARLPLLPKPVQ